MHRPDVAYSSSVSGPFDIFVKPSRRLVRSIERFSSCSFPRGSSVTLLLLPWSLFFYEKARISLMGSSKRRRPRNSRWATSIFLLKINGHADTRKKKNYSAPHWLRVFYDPIVRQFYQSDHTASSMSLYIFFSFFIFLLFSQFLFYSYLVLFI